MQIKKYVYKVATTYHGDWYEEQTIIQYETDSKSALSRLKPELHRIEMTGHTVESVELIEEIALDEISKEGDAGVGC